MSTNWKFCIDSTPKLTCSDFVSNNLNYILLELLFSTWWPWLYILILLLIETAYAFKTFTIILEVLCRLHISGRMERRWRQWWLGRPRWDLRIWYFNRIVNWPANFQVVRIVANKEAEGGEVLMEEIKEEVNSGDNIMFQSYWFNDLGSWGGSQGGQGGGWGDDRGQSGWGGDRGQGGRGDFLSTKSGLFDIKHVFIA